MSEKEIIEMMNNMRENTLMKHLGIEYTACGEDFLEAKMFVDEKLHQPMGFLHGGATAALAESVGSAGSAIVLGGKADIRGIELSCTHLRSIRSGWVKARAEIFHKGRTLHVWQINVTEENDKLISTCRLTNMILSK